MGFILDKKTNAFPSPADFLAPYGSINVSQELLVPFQIDFFGSDNKGDVSLAIGLCHCV